MDMAKRFTDDQMRTLQALLADCIQPRIRFLKEAVHLVAKDSDALGRIGNITALGMNGIDLVLQDVEENLEDALEILDF
jgi:hypothetical protein